MTNITDAHIMDNLSAALESKANQMRELTGKVSELIAINEQVTDTLMNIVKSRDDMIACQAALISELEAKLAG